MISSKERGRTGDSVLNWRALSKLLLAVIAASCCDGFVTVAHQSSAKTSQSLTFERICSEPSLDGHSTRGLVWTPDGKQLSYFETKEAGKAAKTELWTLNVTNGERRLVVSSEKFESIPSRNLIDGRGIGPTTQYQWTIDGTAILFQYPTALALFDLKSQTMRILPAAKGDIIDSKISPDGRYVSFIRNHNLWLVNLADGKSRAITQKGTEDIREGELDWIYPEELGIRTAYWWSPDSSEIAYLEMDERKVSKYPLLNFSSPDGEVEMQRYPLAGGINPTVRILVAAVGGGEPHVIDTGTETEIYIARVNWLADSKHLAIQRLNRKQTTLDLLISDAQTGSTRIALTETDQYWINVSDDFYFFRDSKRFLWSSERTGYRHIYMYDLDGKQIAQLTKGEWEITSIDAVQESEGLVYFTATERTPLERHLYRVALDGSGFTRLTKDAGTHSIKFAPGNAYYVDTYSNAVTRPRHELFRADGSRVAAVQENTVSDLSGYRISPTEFLYVKAHDGILLNAMMIKPPDFNPAKRYPVIVYTYGGPHGQVVVNSWTGSTFLWHQMMAEKGYMIFALDNRGSTGRGHLFEEPLHFRLGAQELSDQLDGVRYLKSLPYVDANRIGIWGWGYGGHMTMHAMFEGRSDFKVGFAGAPVTDWHYYDSIYTERYLGLLPENEQNYQESSPIENATKLKGKLLIAHGTADNNVHFANSLAVINELIETGNYVELLALPGRGHGVTDPPACRILMERVTQFFRDNL